VLLARKEARVVKARERKVESAEEIAARKRDEVFAEKMERMRDFAFDSSVAAVFDDMVNRSVPLYAEQQRMMLELALQYLQTGSKFYDLGCASGNTVLAVAKSCKDPTVRFVGVDTSAPMLEEARRKLQASGVLERCELMSADASANPDLPNASVVTMAWTLQFIRPMLRSQVVSNVYRNLRPGGCFLLMEKLVVGDANLNRLYIDKYYDYKRRQGYSEMEIVQKRESLENILIPYLVEENAQLLKDAGFSAVDTFFRWYNWAGIIGVK
jgi:tRNA (cmo5U34)-methyltransferase